MPCQSLSCVVSFSIVSQRHGAHAFKLWIRCETCFSGDVYLVRLAMAFKPNSDGLPSSDGLQTVRHYTLR